MVNKCFFHLILNEWLHHLLEVSLISKEEESVEFMTTERRIFLILLFLCKFCPSCHKTKVIESFVGISLVSHEL